MLEHHEGRTDLARRLGHKALAAVDRSPITPAQVKASIHSGLAMFEISDGDFELARKNLAQAHQGIMASMDMPVAGQVATVVADFVLASGDPAAAAELLGAGIRLRGMEDLSDLDIQRVASAARAALGPEGYARHLEKGRNLTKEAALALLERSIAVP
jgi:hypothetical protein